MIPAGGGHGTIAAQAGEWTCQTRPLCPQRNLETKGDKVRLMSRKRGRADRAEKESGHGPGLKDL